VDWREWFIDTSRIYRRALIDHPALVALILSQHPHRIALGFYDAAVQMLLNSGVPRRLIIPLIESVESFTLGSLLFTAAAKTDSDDIEQSFKALGEARRRASLHVDNEQLWETVVQAIIDAILKTAPE
jgi:hypothetical protein